MGVISHQVFSDGGGCPVFPMEEGYEYSCFTKEFIIGSPEIVSGALALTLFKFNSLNYIRMASALRAFALLGYEEIFMITRMDGEDAVSFGVYARKQKTEDIG